MTSTIYWSNCSFGEWELYLGATDEGLVFAGTDPWEYVEKYVTKHFPGYQLQENTEKLQPYTAELTEYIEGKRKNFSLPVDARGTAFQLAVWKAVSKIPFGETATYTDIADKINNPKAVRAVGAAIGANPIFITIPCHRIVGKDGKLTGFRGGLDMKTKLLQLEQEGIS